MSFLRCLAFVALPFVACSLPVDRQPVIPRAALAPPAPPPIVRPLPEPGDPGAKLGRYRLTYYWIARQPEADRGRVALRDRRGRVIARVSRAFARRLRMQGTGVLTDGRVINIAGGCRKTRRCYTILGEGTPFGIGARGRALTPFRSVAAPPHLRIGSVLYIPELDGREIPGGGGEVHDGCVIADDRGGGIKGRQLDLFALGRGNYEAFHGRDLVRVTVHRGGERCADLAARPVRIASSN
jgi:3D (Asp-Asp-Asp) domain-containing protein